MKRLKVLFGCRFILLFIFFLLAGKIHSQELSRAELEKISTDNFLNKKYDLAKPGFEELIAIFPKEPSYNYFLGCCYLNLNILPFEAVKYLRFAASKNYKTNAHYFLALAYYRNYQFDEAEISLVNFINLAKNKDLIDCKPEVLLASIAKARQETYPAPDLKVLTREEINYSQIESVYALHVDGKFIPKDETFMQRSDISNNYQGIMYVPVHSENGSTYFITSIGKSGRTGKDIFNLKQLTAMDFSLPIEIEEINTKYDEEYPYFDEVEQVLYFSSNRVGGLGGYDIYKSSFSKTNNKFSEPQRLEFPINTPYDDFLYVPDSKNNTAIFLSNRSNTQNKITAYKISIDSTRKYAFPKTRNEIIDLASLNVDIQKETAPVVIENLSPSREPVILSEYDLLLQDALVRQLYCDSLQGVIISKKNKLRVEENIDERRILVSSIKTDEENLKSSQANANQLFAKAEKLLFPANTTKLYALASNTQTETQVQNVDLNISDGNSETNSKIYLQSESILEDYRFDILENSPYSEYEPIPFEQELPFGLVYRIQLGAFSENLPMNTFGGLTPLTAEKIENRNVVKYYVGYFPTSKAARKALDKVKNYGFKDAFLVPFYNKTKITIQAAREIEFGNGIQDN